MTPEQIIILANVISFIGNALFTSSALFKKKRMIITLQTSNHFLSSVAQFLSKAYSGMLQDSILLVKNIILLFVKEEKRLAILVINILCILAGIAGGITINVILNDNVWYGYLPVIGIGVYSICSTFVFVKQGLSQNTTEVILKSALIFNGIVWCIYGVLVKLYPITIFNSITIVLSIISIVRIIIESKKTIAIEEDENRTC